MSQYLSSRMSPRFLLRSLDRWIRERRMVIALEELDNATLKDIGVSRGEIPWIAQQRCAE
jgi:uncharacterized protein YjiS (DUF1127 family)